MLNIIKDTINTIVVTLTENATTFNPIYLFKFTNQQSNVDYYFISTDTSSHIERYNKFLLTEKTNANTLTGEVTLGNEGFYNYVVYQTNLPNTSGLTSASEAVANIVKSVEVGLVWVVPSAVVNVTYEPSSNTSIVYQYQN
jgi:hypothetical protein